MKIKILILVVLVTFVSGCFNSDVEKFYLDEKYYSNGKFIELTSDEYELLDSKNYVVFTYNNFCTLKIPCESIFKEFMDKYKIDFISIPFDEFKSTNLYKRVKYAPSVIVVKDGSVVAYLDAESDDDLDKLDDVIDKLARHGTLEPKYRDHSLINDKYYKNCRECHIESDWLLVYQIDDNKLNLLLVATGSHSEIFR